MKHQHAGQGADVRDGHLALHVVAVVDNRFQVAAAILRKLKSAGKLTPQQEALLASIESMIAQLGAR